MIVIQKEIVDSVIDSIMYMLSGSGSSRSTRIFVSKYIAQLSYEETIAYSIGIGMSSLRFSPVDREHMAIYLRRATRSISRFRRKRDYVSHAEHMRTWAMNLLPLAYPYEFSVVELPGFQDCQAVALSEYMPSSSSSVGKLQKSSVTRTPLIPWAPLIPGATIFPGVVVPGIPPVPGIVVSEASIVSGNVAIPCFNVADGLGTSSNSVKKDIV